MKHYWFERFGWIYRPVSWQGAAVALLAIAFCVQVFLAIDRRSHSVSDTLYGVFPYFVSCFLLFLWVGSNTSPKQPAS